MAISHCQRMMMMMPYNQMIKLLDFPGQILDAVAMGIPMKAMWWLVMRSMIVTGMVEWSVWFLWADSPNDLASLSYEKYYLYLA